MPKKMLSFPVRFDSQPAEPIALSAFLFHRSGKLLQKTSITSKGMADFKEVDFPMDELQLVIVPTLDKLVARATTLDELEKYRPYKPVLKWDKELNIQLLPIPDSLLKFWKLRFCRVLGNVAKNFIIDDKVVKLPLCKARVHICEVDKISLVLPRIPDDILVRIPDIIFNPPIPPVVVPWPPKPPIPIDPIGPVIFDRLRPDVFRPDIIRPDVIRPNRVAVGTDGINSAALSAPLSALPPINDELKRVLVSKNTELIRQSLIKHIDVLHPYFCLVPWIWPYLYRCDEIKTVYTDENGRFDTSIIYWSGGDVPDLYFWVEYLIDGSWVTVYRPSVPCHTHWDYACGTEVNILVSDGRVRPGCGMVMAKDALWVRRIGASSILNVQQQAINTPIQGVPFNRMGLFKYGTDHRSPLGTTHSSSRMHFIIKFGSMLPNVSASYFRWACRKVANENMLPVAGPVIYLSDSISKGYTTEWTDALGDTHFRSQSIGLGPVNVGTGTELFFIPPASPIGFRGISDATARWDSTDTYTCNLDTRSLSGDGLYEFWLEVFDNAGNQVNKPDAFFQIPKAGDEGNSVNATAPWVGVNNGFNGFNMVVRIDNNACQSAIYPVQLSTVPVRTANPCGFIKYTGPADKNISISFKAFHSNDFADFSFAVVRGNTGVGGAGTPASVSGMVIGPVGRYVRDSAGVYRPGTSPTDLEFSPAELMGPCLPGGKAAFAQSLQVVALHTDGYRRLNELDAGSLAAFALEAP
ncbi:MAG: hypothetical protein IT252_07750 [Chitinophagaceae bacterium]|nr:hypothetical protein [Chitinophagaceae bacterium]